jgi:hypothetical protein
VPTPRRGKAAQTEPPAPNQFHLSGSGLTVSYYPGGLGPIRQDGPICLVYQDASRTRAFVKKELTIDTATGLGTIVTVTIDETVDLGDTTFSLLLPDVRLPQEASPSAAIQTLGITTFHRTFLAGPGQGQQETYSATELTGDARIGPLAE